MYNTGARVDPTDSLASLKQLHHLQHYTLKWHECAHLKDATIPRLTTLTLYVDNETDLKSRELIDFIDRHRKLRELNFKIFYDSNQTYDPAPVFTLLRFALKNLKHLTKFSIASPWFTVEQYLLVDLIREHARPGFVFDRESKYNRYRYYAKTELEKDLIMKRYDGQIVGLKSNSKAWVKLDKSAPFFLSLLD